jgi:hypothetical protein
VDGTNIDEILHHHAAHRVGIPVVVAVNMIDVVAKTATRSISKS